MNQYGDWPIIGWWVSIALACLIAGFAFGWLWGSRSGSIADVKLLDVMTAFGTVGAVAVSLYLSRQQLRVRRQEQIDIASLHAARIALRLRRYIEEVNSIVVDCELSTDSILMHARDSLLDHVDALDAGVTSEDLARLVALPNRAAHRIASGLARIDQLKIDMKAEFRMPAVEGAENQVRKFVVKLDFEKKYIEAGCVECEKAMSGYAKPPSGEELYGTPD